MFVINGTRKLFASRPYKTFDNAIRGAERLLAKGETEVIIRKSWDAVPGTRPQVWIFTENGAMKQ